MRRNIAIVMVGLAVVLPLQLAMAGSDSAEPEPAATTGEPALQLLGDWRYGRKARVRITTRRGFARVRLLRSARIGRCKLRRGSLLVRSLVYSGRSGDADVWTGTARWPDSRCRRRPRPVRIVQGSDLALEARIARLGAKRMRRVRPRLRSDDEILGEWERNRAGIEVVARRRHYVGRAREDVLIANGCRITQGTVVWRLRPSAPGRYDGTARTFGEPPRCAPVGSSRSRWTLEDDGDRLVRETPDGQTVDYQRPR